MRLSKLLAIVGIIAIPAWYLHRSATETRIGRLDWNLFLTEGQRRQREIDEQKEREAAKTLLEQHHKEEAEKARKEQVEKAAKEKAITDKSQACIAEAQQAQATYRNYVDELSRFRVFTDKILGMSTASFHFNQIFVPLFKNVYNDVLSEGEIAQHRNQIVRIEKQCANRIGTEELDLSAELHGAEQERLFFERRKRWLGQALSDLRFVLDHLDQEWPLTMEGELLKDRFWGAVVRYK